MTWQTMDSAPKGEPLDLWSDGLRYVDAEFDVDFDAWCVRGEGGPRIVPDPTHWMRPPASPSGS